MTRIKANSVDAKIADTLVTHLQSYFVKALDSLSAEIGDNKAFEPVEWFRNKGEFGGGVRYVATDETLFNRASVNVSQVQYDSDETKQLASATATIEQLIFDGSYLVGLQAARAFLDYSENADEKIRLEIRKGVINAYASVLLSEELITIFQKNKNPAADKRARSIEPSIRAKQAWDSIANDIADNTAKSSGDDSQQHGDEPRSSSLKSEPRSQNTIEPHP